MVRNRVLDADEKFNTTFAADAETMFLIQAGKETILRVSDDVTPRTQPQ